MRLTRDDKRARALIVRPRGTQRILRMPESRKNPASSFAGGSRPALNIGRGSGVARGGGGGGIGPQASIARALASQAMPAAVEAPAEVFAPQPVSPFVGDGFVAPGTVPGPGETVAEYGPQLTPPSITPEGSWFEGSLPTWQNTQDAEDERLRLARLAKLEGTY